MSHVRYAKRGAIGYLTLDRPDKLNAVDGAMLDAMCAALDEATDDPDVRALVLRGEGRAFSAGFDLDMGQPDEGEPRQAFVARELRRDFDAIMRFWEFPKPSIAAVHGYCLGSAMEISAVCDITVAAEDCRFGAPEVRFGSGIVCLILPFVVGHKAAREMLLTGSDRIDARRAQACGLVNRVVPAADLARVARELAEEIALNDPVAVQLTKRALRIAAEASGLRQALEQALDLDIEIECTETPESREFNRILETEGPKAALRWRASRLPGSGGE